MTTSGSSAPPGPIPRPPGVEARAGRFPGPSLIPLLEAIQAEHGWLPREELVRLAREERRPLYEIQGLVSFYPHFRADGPPRPIDVAVCRDLPCWLAGGREKLHALQERYGTDNDVELHEVSCLGRCDCAPSVWVNEHTGPVGEADTLIEEARAGTLAHPELPRPRRVWPNDPYTGEPSDYSTARKLLSGELEPEAVIAALEDSDLRGMGGAGFPTGLKWKLVRAEDDPVKYVVCNADESEPGTFKDSQILCDQPHLVLEGLLLGMLVVGAAQGFVFIRHEYVPEADAIRGEIARLRELGLIGAGAAGGAREIDVFVSPGGYILGEETALLEAMEGHRGEPRNKPPFPGTYGLWGRPTLINSVETLAHVPVILERGAEWWRDQGVNEATGLKFFAVSGDVASPAVYCVPLGTTVADLLEQAGGARDGRPIVAVQPGGASSNFIGPEAFDTPLDFAALQEAGSMLGSGAVVACAEGTDLLAAATNVLRFFRDESCGKCVPCRVGTAKAHAILTELLADGGGAGDVDDRISALEETLRLTSICGLGQVALGPVVSVLRLEGAAPPS